MKVIFLDFDGVVCCLPTEYQNLTVDGKTKRAHMLNGAAVANLNEIVRLTGAVVVVSSTWRRHQPIPHLAGYLRRSGFEGHVLDVTPILDASIPCTDSRIVRPVPRGLEVWLWLSWHPEVTAYVCLDDDGDRGPIPSRRWVLVPDGWAKGGLQPGQAEQAAAVLGLPWQSGEARP